MRILSLNGEVTFSSFSLQIQIYLHQHRELKYLRPWLRLVWCSRVCRCGRRGKKVGGQISRYSSCVEASTKTRPHCFYPLLLTNHVNQMFFPPPQASVFLQSSTGWHIIPFGNFTSRPIHPIYLILGVRKQCRHTYNESTSNMAREGDQAHLPLHHFHTEINPPLHTELKFMCRHLVSL